VGEPVREGTLPGPPPGAGPLVLEPAAPGVDLAAWAAGREGEVGASLLARGAILFRGFDILDAPRFERAATALMGPLDASYPELARTEEDRLSFRPTPYPSDEPIPFHNEGAHRPQFPLRQAFACLRPADEGGATPLAPAARVLAELPADLRRALEERGLLYERRFVEGLDTPWREFFGTEDRGAVERACEAGGTRIEWLPSGPRIRRRCRVFRRHPATGAEVPFHQLLTHHPALLPPRLRADMAGAGGPLRDARWGDGAAIADDDARRVAAVYERAALRFEWRAGDLLVVDNLLAAHARDAFRGARSMLVALSGRGSDEAAITAAGTTPAAP